MEVTLFHSSEKLVHFFFIENLETSMDFFKWVVCEVKFNTGSCWHLLWIYKIQNVYSGFLGLVIKG